MNFRNVMIALTCMVLLVGLASAQTFNLPQQSITLSATGQTIRAGGLTERPGDVVFTLGGAGAGIPAMYTTGAAAPRFNIIVDYGVPITSRTGASVSIAGVTYGTASEIMLVFDDPGTGGGILAAFGLNAAVSTCSATQSVSDYLNITGVGAFPTGTLQGAVLCPARGTTVLATLNGGNSAATQTLDAAAAGVPAANAYQGLVNQNTDNTQVIFYNVPLLTSNNNTSNTWRVINARLQAPAAGTAVKPTISAVIPVITGTNTPVVHGAFAAPYTANGNGGTVNLNIAVTPNTALTVATAQNPVTAAVAGAAGGVTACSQTALNPGSGQANAKIAKLTFTDGYANAIKTRVLPLDPAAATVATGTGAGAPPQTFPGGVYNYSAVPAFIAPGTLGTATAFSLSAFQSESGVIVPAFNVNGVAGAGLADNGTRFKAVFANLDPNVTYYVTLNNMVDFGVATVAPATIGNQQGIAYAVALPQTGWAAGQNMETQPYAAAGADGFAVGGMGVMKIVQASGAGEAVWEVTNTAKGSINSFTFGVYAVFNPALAAPSTKNLATVQLGLGATTASSGAGSAAIPRFAAMGTATTFAPVAACQTTLLFPFVSGVTGYTTGIAISNTSADPLGTAPNKGACALNFYSSATGAQYTTPEILAGTTWVGGLGDSNKLSADNKVTTLTGYADSGYMIANCAFQFAHGFAWIQQGATATPNVAAMGYLALVINDINTTNARGTVLAGEMLGQ